MSGVDKWPGGKPSHTWYSIAGLLMEMEQSLGGTLILEISSSGTEAQPDLCLKATLVPVERAGVVPADYSFTQKKASSARIRTLEGLITFLLYQLDFVAELKNEEVRGGN